MKVKQSLLVVSMDVKTGLLEIMELKQTDAAAERRRSHSNLYSIKND